MKGKIEKSNVRDIFELNMVQKGMLYHYLKNDNENLYNVQLSFSINGNLNVGLFEQAIKIVQSENEILRSVFSWEKLSKPLQIILTSCPAGLVYHDLSENGKTDIPVLVAKHLTEDRHARFDLISLPLRFNLIRTGEASFTFVITHHHILYDGWSSGILLQELFYYYDQLCSGREPVHIDKPGYKEVLKARRTGTAGADKAYWKNYLHNYEIRSFISNAAANPISDAANNPLADGEIRKLHLTASGKGLDAFAREHNVTKAAVIYSVYGLLLQKYFNTSDVIFGTVVSDRDPAIRGSDQVIGNFINTIPLRVNGMDGRSITEVVAGVNADLINRGNYSGTSYAEIKEFLQLKPADNLFDSVIAVENYPFNEGSVNTSQYLDVTLGSVYETTGIPLLITVFFKEELEIDFSYKECDTGDLDIASFAKYFFTIIDELTGDPLKAATSLCLLSERERQELLIEYNDTIADYPAGETIISLFDSRAGRTPGNIAVRNGDQVLTYHELKIRSEKIAAYLREVKGVGAGDLVGVLLEREDYLIPSIFGILRAGAAYVPIDPKYPSERINAVIADAELKVLITRGIYRDDPLQITTGVVDLDNELDHISRLQPEAEAPRGNGRDLAYVIYTSGSTGKPKGVMIEHHSVVNRILWMQKEYPITERDILLQKTPVVFDVSVWELFWWSFTGASVCLLEPGGEKEPDKIIDAIRKYQVTTIHFVPSMLGVFLSAMGDDFDFGALNTLQKVFASGEALHTEHVSAFRKSIRKYCGTRLINLYGPTEATVDVSHFECTFEKDLAVVPIGKPIANTRLYILDQWGRLSPKGMPGELYIAGVGLARGYLNNEIFTKERFLKDSHDVKEKIYKTGDLVRWLPGGNIAYLGRLDNQVKIRGFRIELGEIESKLVLYSQIKDTAVIVRENDGNKWLIAYYIAKEEIDATKLRTHLLNILPDYMIPAYYVHIKKFPLTSNGKLDRKALPDPEINTGNEYIAATDNIEARLVEIWSAILKTDKKKISVTRSFFDLGGDSLKVMVLTNRIFRELNVKVSISDVFSHPDIRALGLYIKKAKKADYAPVGKTPVKEYYKLSASQRRLYFLYEFDRSSIAFNGGLTAVLEGDLNIERMQAAFQKLIARHEILRTSFEMVDGIPIQKILPEVNCEIEYLQADQEQVQIATRDFVRPFILDLPPLIRVGLIRTSPARHILIVYVHHIIGDGISQEILSRDFMALYNGETLYEPALQYKDFAEWQQADAQRKTIDGQKDFWMNEFRERPEMLELPADYQRAAGNEHRGASLDFEIGIKETGRLRSIADAEGATLFMVVLSLYNILLSKLSNQEDIVIGIPVEGREHPDLENIVGMFVNTLPLRNYPAGTLTFREFLASVRTRALKCFENQSYPYEELIDALHLERYTDRNPLFDTLFAYKNYKDTRLEIPGLNLTADDSEHTVLQFDIVFSAMERNGRLAFTFQYSADLFAKETIELFVVYFKNILSAIARDTDIPLSAIEMMPGEEKCRLLTEFNDTRIGYPEDATLLTLFGKHVRETPDRIAVIHGEKKVSYRELNNRINTIAQKIDKVTGGGRGYRIALLFNSSVGMLASILAVTRTGGVYVPLLPDSPSDRNNYILSDCKAALVLIQEELYTEVYTEELLIGKGKIIPIGEEEAVSGEAVYTPGPVSPDALVYIIYTSGTTGQPKGVAVSHRNLLNYILWSIPYHQLKPEDVALLLIPFHVDGFGGVFYRALFSGGTLLVPPQQEKLNFNYVAKEVEKNKVTWFAILPGLYGELLDQLVSVGGLYTLRFIILAGEQAGKGLIQKSDKVLPGVKLENEYGPTETTIGAVHNKILDKNNVAVIGKPISNTAVYILGKNGELLPIGVRGEIYISGAGVADGYINDEALTKERFTVDPFTPGQRMYKTGDIGRWLQNGNIELSGRIDDQVKIRGFRIELGEVVAQLAAHNGIKEVVALTKEREGNKYLVAWYVAEKGLNTEELRSFLSVRLPEYMIPSFFIHVKQLPYSAAGKLDRNSLPDMEIRSGKNYLAPGTKEEQFLAKIWSEVLGVGNIGSADNFFSIGGDSIKSIQVSSRLLTAGYEISVKDIFTSQTIKDLAIKLKKTNKVSDQSLITGRARLTPIQRWFFDGSIIKKHHFNQSVMLHFKEGISESAVIALFGKLMEHHDALRMVFRKEEGRIVQENAGNELPVTVESFDLRGMKDPEGVMVSHCNKLQSGIDLAKGPLMRLGLFHREDGSRLLIIIHHLVIDGISWRILFEDIEILYRQLADHQPLHLPLKTDPFLSWPEHLLEYTRSAAFEKAGAYWDNVRYDFVDPIPPNHPDGKNTREKETTDLFQLDKEETGKLLTEAHSPFHTQINDLLLTALLLSVKKLYGKDKILIDLEGHGREDIGKKVNVSRTVGWFTVIYPVLLESTADNLSEMIKQVKETLRKVPNNGIDFLLKKYLDQDAAGEEPATTVIPRISFNYLGQFDADLRGKSFSIAREPKGESISMKEDREYDWDISGMLTSGQLEMNLTYSTEQYHQEAIRSLMRCYKESLVSIINYCCNYGEVEFTPSDLTYKGLSIERLDELQREYAIEDIYPLSPMQEGLLFHSRLDPDAEGYFEQLIVQLKRKLDLRAVERTMNVLISRYAILRTLFLTEAFDRPMQIVVKERKIGLRFKDLLEDDPGDSREGSIRSCRLSEKVRKFDLRKDALIRLLVLKTGEDEFFLIWSHHHIIMDGWCMGVILQDFRKIYAGFRSGNEILLPPVTPYSRYIAWLENRDKKGSISYWRNYLASYDSLATLPEKETLVTAQLPYDQVSHHLKINRKQTKLLHEVAVKYGVTINTIFQTAWGILLSKYNNISDVVFGSVISGRPGEIAGVENMVGLFINTVPVRIKYDPASAVSDLFREVQHATVENDQHGFLPLAEIQSLSGLGRGLLNHILVFENYPMTEVITNAIPSDTVDDGFSITGTEAFEQINYDLWVAIVPGEEIAIRFNYNANKYSKQTIGQVAVHLNRIIEQIVSDHATLISEIGIITPGEKHTIINEFNNTRANYPKEETLITLFERQALNTPDKIAVVYEGNYLTYRELNERANRLGHYLRKRFAIRPDDLIGIMCERSEQMIVGLLGILKSGGAYVPIDPAYPKERIEYILADSGAGILLVTKEPEAAFRYKGEVLHIGKICSDICTDLNRVNTSNDLCYLIYTSGSTGKPKGVMISHYNVVNFFSGMNRQLATDQDDSMLAVTSTSFDISVLELFWTLCHGIEVVIYPSDIAVSGLNRYVSGENLSVDFSLFFFSSYNNNEAEKYNLLIEAVKYADQEGFKAVWTPERHFHEFGGLYPNPSVISSALAMITKKIELRSGSVVSPLHDELRIAEEWAVVDNLSNGRVGLSFASGWNPNDFVLSRGDYNNRQKRMYEQIELIKHLWKGGNVTRKNASGQEVSLRIFPAPVQKELPVWVTSAKSEESFVSAGAIGANLLTHLLGQDIEELERKIRLYEEARVSNGHKKGTGKITLMLHTYIGDDINEVEKLVEEPFMEYLRSSIGLGKALFDKAGLQEGDISAEDEKMLVKNAFRRYYQTGSLIGTRNSCSKMIRKLKAIGVDEIACLVDFGIEKSKVLEGLKNLNDLKEVFSGKKRALKHKPITMMQSTPSFIKLMEEDAGSKDFLTSLRLLLIGGESIPAQLVQRFKNKYSAEIYNMYGPTETTIWSCMYKFHENLDKVSIGKPILNTRIYILADDLSIVPIGVPGDLYIGGEGLSRGYWNRSDLTEERFMADPFMEGERIYKTGDIAKWLPDGNIMLVGRADHQVKIRGYRIELAEIENSLLGFEEIMEAVVIAKEEKEGGGKYLAAYVVSEVTLDITVVKEHLRKSLPAYMIPGSFVQLERLPLTPNGKIDRKALPDTGMKTEVAYKAPSDATEEKLVEIWSAVLKIDKRVISTDKSFFELGGHSLHATVLVNRIFSEFNVEVLLQKIFAINTVEQMAEYIGNERLKDDSRKSRFSAIPRTENKDAYALSSAQKRLYVLFELDRDSVAYNSPQLVRLSGKLDKERLKAVFNRLILRHEILRTSFEIVDDRPAQKISDRIDFDIELFYPGKEDIQDLIHKFIRPFDLHKAPLIRVGLIETAHQEYVLMVDMHHIITDGITRGILVKEFMALYNGEELPEQKLQYKDFAEWQQGEEQQARIAKQKDFWLHEFAGEITPLDLPADFSRPAFKSYEGDSLKFEIGREGTNKLKQIGEQEGASLYMVTLSIFAVLVGKLANSEEVVIGTPTAGRQQTDLENIMGMFVNTLPVRVCPYPGSGFREFLSAVKATTLQCFDNQDYPYEELIDELQVPREISRNPLFDIMFIFQNFEITELAIPELTLTPLDNGRKIALFDLSLSVHESGGQIFLNFEYSTALFKKATIERFVTWFKRIIAEITGDLAKNIADIKMMSEKEECLVLDEFNNTKAGYPAEETIISLFEKQVEKTPENIAVRYGNDELDYRGLKERSGRIASYLQQIAGVDTGDLVGIMLEREEYLVPSIFGILKAGGAYVPIDPGYPSERINSIIEDSGIKVLLTRSKHIGTAMKLPPGLVCLDLVLDDVNKLPVRSGNVRIKGSDLAYVIYTSGSTGMPKGVMIEHHSVINRLLWMQKEYPIGKKDVLLQKTPIVFDVSVWELFWWSFTGASLSILKPGAEKEPLELTEAIERNNVTVLHFVPSMLGAFLSVVNHDTGRHLNSLRLVFTSGEALKKEQVNLFENSINRNHSTRLINLYGPTEATVDVSFYECVFNTDNSIIPIGKPIDNTRLYVLDKWGQLTPIGVTGELCIAGAGLARGYLNNKALTEEKFTDHLVTGERIYKTGDLARWLPDGNIEFLGRLDHQVKIRGFRIELGEIECAIADCIGIRDNVVLARERNGEKFLVAYYVSEKEIEVAVLKDYLSEKLPGYMIPAYYVHLETLPVNSNGKLNRKALPDPGIAAGAYQAPSNSTEDRLTEIWSEVLKIDGGMISTQKSFFELGGHSISAIHLSHKIEQRFFVHIGLREIFKNVTIEKQSGLIAALDSKGCMGIPGAERRGYYDASPAQERLFYQQLLDPQSLAYNISGVFRSNRGISIEHLNASFQSLLDRHEALRTGFQLSGDNIIQKISRNVRFELITLDPGKYETVEEAFAGFVRPFDLSEKSLIRCGLLQDKKWGELLFIDLHHIVCDGLSLNILMRDFRDIYQGDALAPAGPGYIDYTYWQKNQKNGLERQRTFWKKKLAGELPVIDLPVLEDRQTVNRYTAGYSTLKISDDDCRQIREFTSAYNVTGFMFLLSAYYMLLSKLSGNSDIIIGTDVAGRTQAALKNIVGTFINILPLRIQVHPGNAYVDFLREVRECVLEAFDNQDFQFDQMLSLVKKGKKMGQNPIVQFHFAFANFLEPSEDLTDPAFVPFPVSGSRATQYELKLEVIEKKGDLEISFIYSRELYSDSFIETMMDYYANIVGTILKNEFILIERVGLANPANIYQSVC